MGQESNRDEVTGQAKDVLVTSCWRIFMTYHILTRYRVRNEWRGIVESRTNALHLTFVTENNMTLNSKRSNWLSGCRVALLNVVVL